MIFVTVGAQMSFDRLIEWVDDWALDHDRSDVLAQVGATQYVPRRLTVIPFMDPPEFRKRMLESDCVIAHAGMGTILTALELAKPILVVPRLGSLEETRNDHQVASLERFEKEGLVLGARTSEEFETAMVQLEALREGPKIGAYASASLLTRVRDFVDSETGT